MKKKKIQHEESGLNSISNKGKIKTLIRVLSKTTNIFAKIGIANKIYELGGTREDILEAEVKRVKKIIKRQKESTHQLWLKFYNGLSYEDQKDIQLTKIEDCYEKFFNKNHSNVLIFYYAPSNMCRLFYFISSCNQNKTLPYVNFDPLRKIIGMLSYIDFLFLISLIDYTNCKCNNFFYYEYFYRTNTDLVWQSMGKDDKGKCQEK